MKAKLKGVCIGTGYFSDFHYDAWNRIEEVEITAISSLQPDRAKAIQAKFNIQHFYENYQEMLIKEKPDFVDIITPPDTHGEICRFAADLGIHIICQKPLMPSFDEAEKLVNDIAKKDVRFIVHENFRFQPWHREIKKLIESGVIGTVHNLNFRSRMGDGWGEHAYLDRQPYFRDYERLLIYETGVHFIDIFRYHIGNPSQVFSHLRRLNPVIKGEDTAMMMLYFGENGLATWDANRYNEHNYTVNRYTFGEYLVEGTQGSIRLYSDGKITIQQLEKPEIAHQYAHQNIGFAGDSVMFFSQHAIEAIINQTKAETEADEYLKTLRVQEAVYQSAIERKVINI